MKTASCVVLVCLPAGLAREHVNKWDIVVNREN